MESWFTYSNLCWTPCHVQSLKCQVLENAGSSSDNIYIYLWIDWSFGVCLIVILTGSLDLPAEEQFQSSLPRFCCFEGLQHPIGIGILIGKPGNNLGKLK